MTQKLNMPHWEPVWKGGIYCSPSCGNNCKRADYDAAVIKAEELAKDLSKHVGGPWGPKVWENMGWHCKAYSRSLDMAVHPHDNGEYWATTTTNSIPHFCSTKPTAREAVDDVLHRIDDERIRLSEILLKAAPPSESKLPEFQPCPHSTPQAPSCLHGICIFCFRDRMGQLIRERDNARACYQWLWDNCTIMHWHMPLPSVDCGGRNSPATPPGCTVYNPGTKTDARQQIESTMVLPWT